MKTKEEKIKKLQDGINSMPEKVEGLHIDRNMHCYCDQYGNQILQLHQRHIDMSLSELKKEIRESLEFSEL